MKSKIAEMKISLDALNYRANRINCELENRSVVVI